MASKPFGQHFDFVWVHYAEWTVCTPMLLTVLGMLSNMHTAEIYMMVAFDLLMIASGYGAQVATAPEAIWPLFIFGCVCQIMVFVILMTHLRAIAVEHDGRPEAKTFTFLSWWVFVWWNFVTLVMVLDKTKVLSYDGISVGYAVGEFMCKIVFGLVVVGTREALEGDNTAIALVAMSLVGIDPEHRQTAQDMRRRNSLDLTAMEEIRALYHKSAAASAAEGGGAAAGPSIGAGYNNPASDLAVQMAAINPAYAHGGGAARSFGMGAARRRSSRCPASRRAR